MEARSASQTTATALPLPKEGTSVVGTVATTRVLRNTYALLALTLLFSAGVAATSASLALPAPGLVVTLAGFFGLLFAVHKLQNSAWSLLAVFGLTGFMGYTLGPVLSQTVALPGGGQTIAIALAATGAVFLSLSGWVLATGRDFRFLGGFLFAGMVIALVTVVAGLWLQSPALALAIAAMVALLSAGLILYETSRIVLGGETNYVLAAVSLYVSIFNLFSSLLALLGFGGNE